MKLGIFVEKYLVIKEHFYWIQNSKCYKVSITQKKVINNKNKTDKMR